jgi:hypothetical protein
MAIIGRSSTRKTVRFAGLCGFVLTALLAAASARADMCFGGGYQPPPKQDAGAKDVAVLGTSPAKRRLGFGLVAAASVGTVWLSFRRRDNDRERK